MEADKKKRQDFVEKVSKIPEEKLIYIDESGIDHTISKDYGWWKKSELLVGKTSGKHFLRTNIVAGLSLNKPIAPFVFHGPCNSLLFTTWIEKVLIKELSPGQTVVMDNASFHKSQKVIDLIESACCKVLFLPPYSPDFNPIEKFWANLKRWIRSKIDKTKTVRTLIFDYFSKL